jgi:hypothetical protein
MGEANGAEGGAAEKRLLDVNWRLSNLYRIIDKGGASITFQPNWAQQRLLQEVWYLNLILKARQLGISTFICLLFLDRCLFNSHVSAGIIAHTREDAEYLFKRIQFAYDNLPDWFKEARSAKVSSARELVFNNSSGIRVGTSMRGATLQYLHISEFGKICAHYPDKAREIVTGSLNTVGANQYIFIESTAEGRGGTFYDMCKDAEALLEVGRPLTSQDYKFHFFPWWQCPDYQLNQGSVVLSREAEEYFDGLNARGIALTDFQRAWYYKKSLTQGDDMKREYPSFSEESFEAANEASWYGKWLQTARQEGRISSIPWDRQAKVFTAWDIGFTDATSIVFFQMVGKEIHFIDFYENSGEGLPHYVTYVKNKPYLYEAHFAPQDIAAHEYGSGITRYHVAARMGISFLVLPSKPKSFADGIESARACFPHSWFDERNCSKLLKALENYRKQWDERNLCYKDVAVHDQYSHASDSFRYACHAIKSSLTNRDGHVTDEKADQLYDKHFPRFSGN